MAMAKATAKAAAAKAKAHLVEGWHSSAIFLKAIG